MNDSSNQLFSKSWQRPGNLAMMASVAAHAVLFAGLALVPATGQQQTAKKQLRVVSLLQAPPNQPNPSNQPVDPNAPPPAPGVAGLPLNITTPDGLAELPVTDAPNPAFDPFASSVVELPPPPPRTSFTPSALATAPQPAPPSSSSTPSASDGPSLSQEDFERWLNGTDDLPGLTPDPGASGPLQSPEAPSGPVARDVVPPKLPVSGIENTPPVNWDNNSLASSSIAPPGETVERFVAYDYPKAACQDRLEGQAEYRIWVSSQATPVVSDIVKSTDSPILDQAVKAAAQKYKIKAEDANKLVVLPFDIKYSSKVCAVKEPTTPEPNNEPEPSPSPPTEQPTSTPTTPSSSQPQGTSTSPQPVSPTPSQPQPSVAPPESPTLPATPQSPVQPVAPPESAPPVVQPPAAGVSPTPPTAPVQPAVPLQASPSNTDLPQPAPPQVESEPPADEKPATVPAPAAEPDSSASDSPAN